MKFARRIIVLTIALFIGLVIVATPKADAAEACSTYTDIYTHCWSEGDWNNVQTLQNELTHVTQQYWVYRDATAEWAERYDALNKANATAKPCVDVVLEFHAVLDPADKVFCVEGPVASEILSYRAVVDELGLRYSDLWSETHSTITNLNFRVAELEGEVQSLRSKVDRKNAKLAELRAIIRDLRNS